MTIYIIQGAGAVGSAIGAMLSPKPVGFSATQVVPKPPAIVNSAVTPIRRMPMKRKVFPHQVFRGISFSFSKKSP